MSTLPKLVYTPEEYLAIDRKAEVRSEYLAGEIRAMAGGSIAHDTIAVNVIADLRVQLRGGPCRPYSADMRVRVGSDMYAYPDVFVICGKPQLADRRRDVLLNPLLIVEVLSPSTEAYDRGDKFEGYQQMESFQEYLLIAQDRPHVEHFVRQPDGQWLASEADGLEAVIALKSIPATLALAEIYDGVDFEVDSE